MSVFADYMLEIASILSAALSFSLMYINKLWKRKFQGMSQGLREASSQSFELKNLQHNLSASKKRLLNTFSLLLPPERRSNFIGDLMEMQEIMKDEGESQFYIFCYSTKNILIHFCYEFLRMLKELPTLPVKETPK